MDYHFLAYLKSLEGPMRLAIAHQNHEGSMIFTRVGQGTVSWTEEGLPKIDMDREVWGPLMLGIAPVTLKAGEGVWQEDPNEILRSHFLRIIASHGIYK